MNLPRYLYWALVAVPLLALAVQIWAVADNWRWYQYDFRAYYTGPALHAVGKDPYSLEAHLALVRELGLGEQRLAFVYSPAMLWLLGPLATLPYPVAYGLWLCVNTLALGTVLLLSVRVLTIPAPYIAWTLAFGLNGTVAAVLRSGQFTLMVLAVVLLGVWALKAGRWRVAGALLTLAAIPKVWVVPLLSMVAVPIRVGRLLWVAGGVGLCALFSLSGRYIFPGLQDRYETIVSRFVDFSAGPAGPYNGTVLNILATLEELGMLPEDAGTPLWLAFACVVVAVSALVSLRLGEDNAVRIFVIVALGLCLISPRMVLYQWTLAIPALAFVLSRIGSPKRMLPLAIMALIPTLYVNRYILDVNIDAPVGSLPLLIWSFSNFIVVFTFWIVALRLPVPDSR